MRPRIFALLLIALAEMGQAGDVVAEDAGRIIDVPYSADRVVPLRATPGFAVVVEMSDDERVETLVVGSSAGWQVTTNKRGDHVIVKPLPGAAPTDLVVTTDVRRYVFLLQISNGGGATPFVLHFTYPELPIARPTEQSLYNFRGDKQLFPLKMTDDGDRTRIVWSARTALPAVFAIDGEGHEALVNGRMENDIYVIRSVAAGYVFRRGHLLATANREVAPDVR